MKSTLDPGRGMFAGELAEESVFGARARYSFEHFVGEDPILLQVLEKARRAAPLDLPVLVSGESGTGKEVLAQGIHCASPRASAPFIGFSVVAISRDLLESELFGYEGGAFTGARSEGQAGKFEAAGKGTILLDEIGDMPLEMQGTLLRVLQERAFHRVGGTRNVPLEARVIATTNRDLEEAVRAGHFRLDLLHRLRVVHLHMPPLRQRTGDIRLLLEQQLRIHSEREGRTFAIAPGVLTAMEQYAWPGNVRELLNVVESELRLLPPGERVLCSLPAALERGLAVEATAGPTGPPLVTPVPAPMAETMPLAEIVRRTCLEALARTGGNVAAAARALGVSKGTLYRRLQLAPGSESNDEAAAGGKGLGETGSD